MKRNDTTNQIELLLTLDYLINYTDKNHPTTQQDICKYVKDLSLKNNLKLSDDNEIRIQRIAECFQFLQDFCNSFKDTKQTPFNIKITESGKYYLEKKNDLTEEQIIKILTAIKNDKYTNNEDTDFLIEKLLNTFSNCFNKDYLKNELLNSSKIVSKYNFANTRKIRLIYEAYNRDKTIRIKHEIIHNFKFTVKSYESTYIVYKIKEFENKPYVLLLRVSTLTTDKCPKMIFEAIENLNIPDGKDEDILSNDFKTNRDLNKLYAQQNKFSYLYYKDIDKMIEANIRPQGGFAFVISFYFNINYGEIITNSFENFFSQPLKYTKCTSFDTLDEQNYGNVMKLPKKNDKGILIPHMLKDNEEPKFCVANVLLNANAFKTWVISNYSNTSNIGDIIHIVAPTFIKEDLAYYFYSKLTKYFDNLNDKYKNLTYSRLKRDLEKDNNIN